MDAVFRKLQLGDRARIHVERAPDELLPRLEAVGAVEVSTSPRAKKPVGFALFFVRSCADIAKLAPRAAAMLEDDGVLWFAYPKKSSKRYTSDIGRDDGWQPLGDLGFEGVRQVAIDDDWSALRFRRVDHIRKLRRDPKRALSAEGKKRAARER